MLSRIVRSAAVVVLLAASLLLSPALAMPQQTGPAAPDPPAGSGGLAVDPGPRIEPGAREHVDLRDLLRQAEPAEAAQILWNYAREKGIPLDERPSMPDKPDWSILLSAVTLVPTPGIEPALQADLPALQEGEAEVPLILQFTHRLSLGEEIELYDLGLKGLAYERPNYARIVLAPAASLPALLEKPFLRWVGGYGAAYKYGPAEPGEEGTGWAFVHVIDRDRAEYRNALAVMGIAVDHYDDTTRFYYAQVGEAHIPAVADLPWVRWIEREPEEVLELLQATPEFEADDSREMVGAFESFRTGAGVTVGVRDAGIFWNGTEHVDFAGRVAPGSHTIINDDHGTHVTGIIIAGGTIEMAGAYDARGVAPGASVLFQRTSFAYSDAFATWQSNGVQISNHSYGFGTDPYDYDSNTAYYDERVDNDDMIVVKSAGNDGPAVNTITNPGTGKNVITVGAVLYVTDDSMGKEVGDIAVYSSRGPTLENGRLKPELVAPGGQSGVDYGYRKYGVVSCNDNPDGDPTDDPDEWPEDDHYARKSGTSMAAPHVTGALALMKESYPNLSSEAAKARLIGGTIPLKSSSGTDPRNGYANTEAGFGLLNAYHAAGHVCDEAYTLAWEEGAVDYDNDSDEYTFTVPPGTEQLVVVMVYNDDAAGDDTGQIGDDLDLWLEDDLGTAYSYVLPAGVTAPGTVEKVIVESPRSGVSWTAHVVFEDPSPWHSSKYSLYILAILERPELGLSATLPHGGYYAPGEAFTLSTTAENPGDWIVAGVTGKVTGDVGGEKDKVKFYDSLVCNADSKTVTFDLQAPANWGPHDFQATARGVNRGLADDSVPLSIVVCNTTSRPGLVQPAGGTITCDATPLFEWNPMAGAPSYRLQVDDDSGFGSPAINTTTGGTQYMPGSPLPAGYYYWRVRGEADSCQGLWSSVRGFTVKAAPAAPGLSYPGNGGETCDTTPYLIWNWVSEATLYQIQVDGSSGFLSPEVDDTISGTAYTVDPALSPDTYYWRVRAQNSCGWGPWSPARSFTIPDAVNPPELYTPEHGSDTCDTTPTLDWSDMSGASLYVIQVDDNSDLGSPEIEATVPNSQYTPWPPLAQDRYYWRVRTYTSCGYGIWSAVHSFDVVGVPPVATHITPADGSEQCNANLNFDWSSQWATSYRLWVDNHPSFGSPEIAVTTSNSWYAGGDPLAPGHYYWRVWAENVCGSSGWSSPWSLTVVELPDHPVLVEPVGAVLCDPTPTFWWSVPTMGISQYRLQVNDIPDFDDPDRDVTTPDAYYTLGAPLDSPKTWYWRVNAQNACGTGPWSSYGSFRLTTVAPSTPSLVAPTDGSEMCDTTPMFDWSSVSWTSSYQIEVDDDPNFGSPEVNVTISDSEYTPGTALPPGTYHWRVRACNDCGCSTWTSAWDLAVRPTPDAPFHTSPSDGSTTGDSTPSLTWHYVVDAVEYRIQIDDDAGFGSPDPDQTTANTTFSPGSPLANGTYHWRVQASNSVCWGPWSDAWQLSVDTNCDTVPKPDPVSPPVGSETCDTTPTFEWSIVSGASHYQFQLDDDFQFPAPIVDTTTIGTSYSIETELDYRSYYWRVRGCNACGCGSWSSLRSFEVSGPPWYTGPFPLLTPPDGSSTCDLTPTFDWVAINDTTYYEIEVDNDAGFTSPEIDAAPSASTYTPGSNLSPGTYDWRVRPCNGCGCGEWSQTWGVDLLSTPAVPSLTSPADGSTTGDDTPSFGWGSVFGGTTYAIQADDDPGFGSAEIDDITAGTFYTATIPLPDATYHWRVQALNACDTGAWSSPWQLTVDSTCLIAISPTLSLPAQGASTCDATPAFAWSPVSGATSYQVQVDESDSGFPSPLIDTTMSNPDYTPGTELLPDTYHWRARACNECGCGPWSSAWNVTITAIPGVVPLLLVPATGSTTCDPTPNFDWLAIGDASSYEIQINDSPTFSSPIIGATVLPSLYTPASPLPAGIYYWQVRACNDCGCGTWSATWNITIGPPASAPSLASPPDGYSTGESVPTFVWSPVGGTERYELEVDGDPTFPSPLIDIDAPDPLFTPASPLPPGTFFWRVQAHNACGSSGWSGYWMLVYADFLRLYLPLVVRGAP